MNRSRTLLILTAILAMSNVSCADPTTLDAPKPLRLTVGKVQVSLEARNGKCHAISSQGGSATQQELDIPWPCHFHTNRAGEIRTIRENGYAYGIIESSRPKPKPSADCETYLQSIRIKGAITEVSQHKDQVASCPPFQWDEYIFLELFDQR